MVEGTARGSSIPPSYTANRAVCSRQASSLLSSFVRDDQTVHVLGIKLSVLDYERLPGYTVYCHQLLPLHSTESHPLE